MRLRFILTVIFFNIGYSDLMADNDVLLESEYLIVRNISMNRDGRYAEVQITHNDGNFFPDTKSIDYILGYKSFHIVSDECYVQLRKVISDSFSSGTIDFSDGDGTTVEQTKAYAFQVLHDDTSVLLYGTADQRVTLQILTDMILVARDFGYSELVNLLKNSGD